MKQLVKIANPGEFALPDVAQHYGRAIADALERSDASDRVVIFADSHGLEVCRLEDGDEPDLCKVRTPPEQYAEIKALINKNDTALLRVICDKLDALERSDTSDRTATSLTCAR